MAEPEDPDLWEQLLAAVYALQIICEAPRDDSAHGLACSWAASHVALTWATLGPEDQQAWLEAQPEPVVDMLREAMRAFADATGEDMAARATRLRAQWKAGRAPDG
jgi:hypothetical protein